MVDLTQFQRGIDAARAALPDTCADPRSAFLSALSASGMTPPKSIVIGRIDRIDGAEDKRGARSAWYIYQEVADSSGSGAIIGIGGFGDWKTGLKRSWCSKSEHRMDSTERAAFLAARENLRIAQEAETQARQSEAAALAFKIWQDAPDCIEHEYLTKKKIKPSDGLKIGQDGRLIIPVCFDNQIVSLQHIAADSTKRFLTGGLTKGAWFKIEGTGDTVYVAEGYATAASIHEATGATVYIAFYASNLYEISATAKAQNPSSRVIVTGDDDTKTVGNQGRTKAEQAAEGLGLDVLFPVGYKDFNDWHCAEGIAALTAFFHPNIETYQKPPQKAETQIERPVGFLEDVISYYNATSGNAQHGFAVQTALALASVILGRSYKTSLENFTALYFINVGKSGTGKEHTKTVIEKILHESNMGGLISGDSYTSAGAVFSALHDRPRHISVIDEFGRHLEAGRDMGRGESHKREANTKLMEAIGRTHSIIRPPTYSTMTLKKEAAEVVKNRHVYNPSITLLAMTTPDTLFKTLDMGAIKDGFINRFIINISDTERSVRRHKPPVDVPQRILNWIAAVTARHDKTHIASEPASPILLDFSTEALELQEVFGQFCVDTANALDRFGMAELPGRSCEMAMRISLICALSRNSQAKEITGPDMEWAIRYIKSCLEKTIMKLKISISHSDFERHKKEILADLRSKEQDGMTWAAMQKSAPYSQHKPKDLKEILQSLKDADLIIDESAAASGKGGRPTILWRALK
jgi:phage/plasmid primase-like uncharacterized protein